MQKISARSKADLQHVVEHRSEVEALRVRVEEALTGIAETEERIEIIESRRNIVDDVQRKTNVIVNVLEDVRVNLEMVSEQKAMIDQVVENVATLDETLREAQATLKRLRIERELAERIERYHGRPPIAWSRHVWTRLALLEGDGEPEYVEVEWLRGRRLLTLLGVGNPQSIIDQLEQAGATVSVNIPARDHQRYEPAIVTVARGLCDGVEALVMTAKDWVKARRLIDPGSWPVPIVVPWLEIDVFEGGEALKDLVGACVTKRDAGS